MKPVLMIDFGSTNTKVTAVDLDEPKLLGTAASYTTVETDIGEGLAKAMAILKTKTGDLDFTARYACSSAAGGLKMLASGLVPELTAEAARQAALGAGAKVLKTYSFELTEDDAEEIETIKPDIFLLTGGTDGGNKENILQNARVLADLQLDFPIVIAGNRSVARQCEKILQAAGKNVTVCENVMPKLGQLNIEPAQSKIREIFLERIIKAKGLSEASELISGIMMPTPAAVLEAMKLLAKGTENENGIGDLIGVDVGGATTDIYSMASGEPERVNTVIKGLPEPYAKRTVEGDIGMRYGATGIVEAVGSAKISSLACLEPERVEELIRQISTNTDMLPTTDELERLDFALAKSAIETGLTRHAGTVEKTYTPMGEAYMQSGKDLTKVEKLVITGGSLIHTEKAKEIAAGALFNMAEPSQLKPFKAEVLVDKQYILSAMGLLGQHEPDIALKIMKKELSPMELQNKKLTNDEFYSIQKEVLQGWPTGADVDFDDAVKFHEKLADSKNFSKKLSKAKKEGKTLVQPRAGVALVKDHIDLLTYLQNEGGADLLPTTIDSYTRQNRYKEAEVGIQESVRECKSMLNGLPVVNHGVDSCRQIITELDTPVQIRHGTPDARLLTEISYAGGFTSYEGGGISYNIPYAKNVQLEKTIRDWQYCDRLTGIYEEAGISINREPYGPLTGTLVPPCISHSVAIIESLLAAEQGVKNITVGYGQCGNLVQDVAAIRSLLLLTEEYLHKFGFDDVEVTTVLHQWMGGFPQDEAQAFAVISWGSTIAALSNATKVIVKTPHEAVGVPTKEANAQGLRCTKQMISMLSDQQMSKTSDVLQEMMMISAETRCIVDKCLDLGAGDLAVGVVRAFQAGVLDVPFAPSKFNAGKMLPARDNDGAIRILNAGGLPLTKDLIDFNKEKIEERARAEKRPASFQMVIDDVYAISKGRLVGRP